MAKRKEIKETVIDKLSYKKKEIKILDMEGKKMLSVGKEMISCVRNEITGSYSSDHFPYQTFGSLQELGKAIVDQ